MSEEWGDEERRSNTGHFCEQHAEYSARIAKTSDDISKARTISEVVSGRMTLLMWGFGIFLVAALAFMGTTSAAINKMGTQVATIVTANSLNKKYIAIHEASQDSLLIAYRQDIDNLQQDHSHYSTSKEPRIDN
jgi:hypothetical protein